MQLICHSVTNHHSCKKVFDNTEIILPANKCIDCASDKEIQQAEDCNDVLFEEL